MPDQPQMRIGQVAAESGVSIDTIRYYERLGLLPQARRTRGGFRLYSRCELARLGAILEAKRLGLSLQQIRDLFEAAGREPKHHCEDVRSMLDAQLRDVDARMVELRALKGDLMRALEACRANLATDAACCPVSEDLPQVIARPVPPR